MVLVTTLEGWPEDERDHIEYAENGDLHEVRKDRLWDKRFADEVKGCSQCGQVLPADRLWVVKYHHSTQPKGHLRSYCSACLMVAQPGPGERLDPGVPTCPIHFTKMLGGVCDRCD